MYIGSTEFNNLIEKSGGNALITRFKFSNFSIEKFTKLEYYGGSNSSDDIAIGTTNMAYLDVSTITNKIITNQEFLFEVGMKLSDGTVEYAPIGYFKVQKPDENEDTVDFTAYDRMQKFEKPYVSSLVYPTDSSQILNEVCTMCGVELATPITSPITITDKLDGYTCREILGYIAGIHGFFACFDRYGKLNLRWYSETPIEKQIGLIWSLTKSQSNYKVEKITIAKNTETAYTSGTGISGINHSNPYATQEIAAGIYTSLGNFTYRPCEISMLDDIRLDPWDMLKVTYFDGSVLTIPVMALEHSFTSGETRVKSFGKTNTENEYNYSGPVTQAMDRMATELLVANRIIATKVDAEWVNAHTVTADKLEATNASINKLKTDKLDATYADIINANVESLKAVNADIANLKADYEKVGILDASVADIKTLIFGSATGTTITTDFSNSVIAVLGEAQIKSAMIDSLDASKITALDINTTNVLVHSEDGKSKWKDNTIQISDSNRVRVQIGKDANSDYNMYIWDKSGNLMFDAIGLTDKGIQRQVIRDDMVKDNADIAASKLNIGSLFTVINNDGSHTLNSTKIYVDSEQQTLDSVFKSIQTTVGGNSILWGSAIKQSKDFIDQKLWWTDIRNGESIESKFNTVTSTLDSFGVQIGDVYKQLNDDFKVYQVTYEPTNDNYPANEWSVPIYPSDDIYPSDSIWQYTESEYDNYVGIIAYWEAQNRAWRWIKKIDGTHGWKEISSTEIAYLLNQNAALKVNLNTISSELSKTQIDIRDNYSTTVQVNNAITQAVSAESNSIKSEISTTYATKDALTGYSTTEAMNNAITQAITKESNSIKLEVSGTYATKKSLESYATTDSLKSYATSASLEAYIKKDPTTGELKSAIEAIADDITLNASGTINISGNKSVNINGNLFTLTSTNTTITADGRATFKAGAIGSWNIEQNKLSSTVQAYIPPDIDVLNTISGALKAGTADSLNKSLYDFNGDGTIDLFDFAKVKRYYLRLETYNNTTSAIAQLSNVTANIDPTNLDKVINISGTDMWGTKRETYIGINGLKTDSVKSRDAYLSYMTIDGGNSNYSTDSDYALNAQSIKTNEIYANELKVASSVLMMCPTSNIQIYNNPRDMYGNPVLCMDNPISFTWSDGILRIYVDNTIVASWIWGEQRWE